MVRILAYTWLTVVMAVTAFIPDFVPVLKVRGWLVRWCFKSCGKHFQVASGVRILYSTNISVGDDVYIAPGCWVQGIGGVELHDQVMLGPYTILATNNHTKVDGSYRYGAGARSPIVMERGSWTGGHVVITAGSRIGQGTAVAAGGVVTCDLPPHAIAGGVPAKVIRSEVPG